MTPFDPQFEAVNFTVFDARGMVLKTGYCPRYLLDQQVGAGEYITEGVAREHQFVDVASGTFADMASRPSEHHAFDYITKQWIDPRTLQDLQNAQWERIKAAREAAIDAPLVTPYGTVDSKAKDRNNITDAVLMLQTLAAIGQPTTIDFTMTDNSTVTLTTTEMVTIGLMLGQKVQAAHSTARTRRAAIDAATTLAEVEAITW